MDHRIIAKSASVENARCPYCGKPTTVDLPCDYEPVYAYCNACRKKFIAERLMEGFLVMTLEEAPCCSDPDCREVELGGYAEE